MADTLTATQRSERMSRVRGQRNNSTELRLIALMRQYHVVGWRRGIALPGKPDFVFRAEKLAVFVDGCFWHGCARHGRMPKSRVAFWRAKLLRNAERDRSISRTLRTAGWTVMRIWECALSRRKSERTLLRLVRAVEKRREK